MFKRIPLYGASEMEESSHEFYYTNLHIKNKHASRPKNGKNVNSKIRLLSNEFLEFPLARMNCKRKIIGVTCSILS